MMMILAAVSLFALLALYLVAPAGQLIHAARSRDVLFRRRVFPLAPLYRDEDGQRIDLTNAVVGVVAGASCVQYGIPDGAVVIGDKVSDDNHDLRPGDVVIMDAELDNGQRPQRFRCVAEVSDGEVHFCNDAEGTLKPKRVGDILARVKYVEA
ncbi:MAG: hypothetical protein WBR13_00755 [Allosphingosinicella sp.]